MIRKITIATISVLLSASILFTMLVPLIPTALDIHFFSGYERDVFESKLIIFGLIISFVLATILILICVFWKKKSEEDEYTRKTKIIKDFEKWITENKDE